LRNSWGKHGDNNGELLIEVNGNNNTCGFKNRVMKIEIFQYNYYTETADTQLIFKEDYDTNNEILDI